MKKPCQRKITSFSLYYFCQKTMIFIFIYLTLNTAFHFLCMFINYNCGGNLSGISTPTTRVEERRCHQWTKARTVRERHQCWVHFALSFLILKPQGGAGKQARFYRAQMSVSRLLREQLIVSAISPGHCVPGSSEVMLGRQAAPTVL